MFALDGICWALLARLANRTSWRPVITLFMGAQVIGLAWLIFGRLSHSGWDRLLPKFAVAALFIWHCLGLPLVLGLAIAFLPILLVKAAVGFFKRPQSAEAASPANPAAWTRRQFLGFAAAAAPPLFTLSLATIAMRQLNQFRVRRFVLPIRELPRDLNGMTIAQVSDMHVG